MEDRRTTLSSFQNPLPVAETTRSNGIGAAGRLLDTVDEMRLRLAARQRPDGHWVFLLEADATIPSEYIFLQHYLGRIDAGEAGLAKTLRAIQQDDGGWPLVADGPPDLSASVKAYYALKLAGDDPQDAHMRRARKIILGLGGAECANVFTRTALALFGQLPWRAVPVMPIEIMLLPSWSPFHISKVSYWSRTVIVPMLLLRALKARARNPSGAAIPELFVTPPDQIREFSINHTGSRFGEWLLHADRALRAVQPLFPGIIRRRAIAAAVDFMTQRLNGEDGLGGIFPAMSNAVMALDALGHASDSPPLTTAVQAIKNLLTMHDGHLYCQPCLSPVWDTCLAMHALLEAGEPGDGPAMRAAGDWLLAREIRDVCGDWSGRRPDLQPGGWAFQYRNDYYNDVDDTAVVAMALHRAEPERYRAAIQRSVDWIIGMQSRCGGWGAFDADNTHFHLNHIPFADHGALLDPPTADVTARCLGLLAQLGYARSHPVVRRALEFLRREQEGDGSWFGRWGINYVYGTWSVLCALNAIGEDPQSAWVRRAVDWLKSRQRTDGGWGEDCETYSNDRRDVARSSTASQTAWALLGLMAAGEVGSLAVRRGVGYLERLPRTGTNWQETHWTGTGFPRVFYLKYHGYSAYYPLWALARYRHLMHSSESRPRYGI